MCYLEPLGPGGEDGAIETLLATRETEREAQRQHLVHQVVLLHELEDAFCYVVKQLKDKWRCIPLCGQTTETQMKMHSAMWSNNWKHNKDAFRYEVKQLKTYDVQVFESSCLSHTARLQRSLFKTELFSRSCICIKKLWFTEVKMVQKSVCWHRRLCSLTCVWSSWSLNSFIFDSVSWIMVSAKLMASIRSWQEDHKS